MPVLALGAAVILGVAVLIGVFFAVTALVSALGPRSLAESPQPQPTVATVPSPVPVETPLLGESTPQPSSEFVRVANTGGTGAFIREEPRATARGIAAYPDRTVLRVIGGDVTADGRIWRNVEDPRGIRGWTPGEFLVPSDTGF